MNERELWVSPRQVHSIFSHADSSASCWQCTNIRGSDSATVLIFQPLPSAVDSCYSSELYSVLWEWMKGVAAARLPHGLLGGLGREGQMRSPAKLLWVRHIIDSQRCGLITAGNDKVTVNRHLHLTFAQEVTQFRRRDSGQREGK